MTDETTIDPDLLAALKEMMQQTVAYMKWSEENFDIADGSPIDADDRSFTEVSMRETVMSPIKAAIDQLLLTTVTIDKWPNGIRGFAHPTLMRSAITSASTAVWILHPDTTERRLRALQIAHENLRNEINYLEGYDTASAGNLEYDQGDLLAYVARRRLKKSDLIQNGFDLGYEEKDIKQFAGDYRIVEAVSKSMPIGAEHRYDVPTRLLSEWRLLSGRAHGLPWPTIFADSQPSKDSRFAVRPITLPLDRILVSIHLALSVVGRALDQFAELAGVTE